MTSVNVVTAALTWMGWGRLANNPPAPNSPIRSLVESLWLVGRQPRYPLDNPNQVAQSTALSQRLDGATTVSPDAAVNGNAVASQTAGPALDSNVTPDARVDDQADAVTVATNFANSMAPPLCRWLDWKFKVLPEFEPDLVINALGLNAPPRLSWRILVGPAAAPHQLGLTTPQPNVTYLVYANGADAGRVIQQGATAQAFAEVSSTTMANDVLGRSRDINVSQLQLLIFSVDTLNDQARHIATYQSIGLNALGLAGIPVIEGPWGWNPSAVSAHANMGVVYDYYKDVLGLNSFDGNGAPIAVAVDYNPLGPLLGFFSKYDNAYWDANTKELVFGDGADLEGALDIVGHEYTHAVVSYVVGQGNTVWESGESGALNEAYADILGSLIEGKSGPDRWLMGEDSTFGGGALRSLADPTSFSTPYGHYRDNYATRYTGTEDQGGVHGNSTIFSHAAYLMMTDPATSGITDDAWATVFYQSLYRLGPAATFSDGRAAVLDSAIAYGFTGEQQAAVERAFDDVGIVAPTTVMV